jgi:hypothetical protein
MNYLARKFVALRKLTYAGWKESGTGFIRMLLDGFADNRSLARIRQQPYEFLTGGNHV